MSKELGVVVKLRCLYILPMPNKHARCQGSAFDYTSWLDVESSPVWRTSAKIPRLYSTVCSALRLQRAFQLTGRLNFFHLLCACEARQKQNYAVA